MAHVEQMAHVDQMTNRKQIKNTLESHEWFATIFADVDIKQQKEIDRRDKLIKYNKETNEVTLLFAIICIPLLFLQYHYIIFLLRVLILAAYATFMMIIPQPFSEKEKNDLAMVHMRFTRAGIFYMNTHYIFSGTKPDLQRAFDKLQKEIEADKAEPYFGRGDHDNLLDMPLDTFYNNDCSGNTIVESQWKLFNYASVAELNKDMQWIKLEAYKWFPNEIITMGASPPAPQAHPQ